MKKEFECLDSINITNQLNLDERFTVYKCLNRVTNARSLKLLVDETYVICSVRLTNSDTRCADVIDEYNRCITLGSDAIHPDDIDEYNLYVALARDPYMPKYKRELVADTKINERTIRKLCELSRGEILSGQSGHILTRFADAGYLTWSVNLFQKSLKSAQMHLDELNEVISTLNK